MGNGEEVSYYLLPLTPRICCSYKVNGIHVSIFCFGKTLRRILPSGELTSPNQVKFQKKLMALNTKGVELRVEAISRLTSCTFLNNRRVGTAAQR